MKGRSKGLRFSLPPYMVAAVSSEGHEIVSLPGDTYEMLERGFAPSAAKSRRLLVELRQKLNWSRPQLSAFMGVSLQVVRSWECGTRQPTGAARRLVWLLHLLAHNPDGLKSAIDLIFWGRSEEMATYGAKLTEKSPAASESN